MNALCETRPWAPPGQIRLEGFSLGHAPAVHDDAPIGLYDSGVGGLTVLAAIARHLPAERFIYIADQAHVPYGGRPLAEVRTFAGSLARYLFDRGCKAAVMACNISSATALDEVEAHVGPEHILGVIHPGARAAAEVTRSKRVGVLATAGTVASGAYPRAIEVIDTGLAVHQMACPKFVPLVEAGRSDSPEAHEAALTYLEPLLHAGVDTVILGCTHYPFLLPTLRRIAPAHVQFVDPAEETALTLKRVLQKTGRVRSGHADTRPGHHQLLTTGDPSIFTKQLAALTPSIQGEVAQLPWSP